MRSGAPFFLGSLRRDAVDFGAVGAAVVVAQLFALGTNMVVARIAGPTVFGQFTAFITILALVTTVGNALDATFIRLSGRLASGADLATERIVHLVAKLCYAALMAAVGLGLVPSLEYGGWLWPGATLVFGAGMIAGGLVSIYNALVAQYRQQNRFVRSAVLLPALNVFSGAAVGLLALSQLAFGHGHLAAVYLLVSAGLALIASGAVVRLTCWPVGPWRARLTRHVREGLPLVGAAFITVLSSRLDVFFLSAYGSFEELGFYGAGLRIALVVGLLNTSLALMIQPRAATALHSRDEWHRFVRFSSICCLLILCVAGTIGMSAKMLVSLLFGDEYGFATVVTLILLIQVSLNGCYLPFRAILECHRPTTLLLKCSCLQLAVAATLMTFLVPRHGATGTAWAVTAATGLSLVLFVWNALQVVQRHQSSWGGAEGRTGRSHDASVRRGNG